MDNIDIQVKGNLTGDTTGVVREQCIHAAHKNSAVTINMAEVTTIDDAGILLLLQLRDFAKDKNIPCTLEFLSPELFHVITLLGLHDTLILRSTHESR